MKKLFRLLLVSLLTLSLTVSLSGCSELSDAVNNGGFTAGDEQTLASGMEVHFIDIGQGDSILIQADGHNMLIDAGDNNKGTAVQNYLQKQGVTKLDYVIGTHPDSDHIGGLDVIITKFDCENVFLPDVTKDTKTYRDVVDALKYRNYPIKTPAVGDTYALGNANFTIVAPNSDHYEGSVNDYSIGVILENGENRFLFLGDAEETSEKEIVANGIDISADVYKASHHGSRSSSTTELLNAVNPEFAVISCGEGNKYGHPHAQTLNTLRQMGVKVYRTDEQGSIVAYSNGTEITWNCAPSESWQTGEGSSSDQENVNSSEPEQTYVLNTKGMKFHLPDCTSVAQMSEKNKETSSDSREAIIAQGYEACERCKP